MRKPQRDLWWRNLRWIVVLLGAAALLAVGHRGSVGQIPPRGNIQIINIGTSALTYHIRPNNGIWTPQKIQSGGTNSFNCIGCTAFEVRISTGTNEIIRTLPSNRTYQIFWNGSAWDVAPTPRR
jgi:hypothetical protein